MKYDRVRRLVLISINRVVTVELGQAYPLDYINELII